MTEPGLPSPSARRLPNRSEARSCLQPVRALAVAPRRHALSRTDQKNNFRQTLRGS